MVVDLAKALDKLGEDLKKLDRATFRYIKFCLCLFALLFMIFYLGLHLAENLKFCLKNLTKNTFLIWNEFPESIKCCLK